MDILEIINTIKEHWALLVFVFGLGGAWFQGKMWFEQTNKTLSIVGEQHEQQNRSLEGLHTKIDSIDDRLVKVENTVTRMHEELHDQEIKLAVLETTSSQSRRITKK